MPIEYSLEKDRALVMARATGVISIEDFKDFQKILRADVKLQGDHLPDQRFERQLPGFDHRQHVRILIETS